MPRYHVVIEAPHRDAMAELVRRYKVVVARHTIVPLDNGAYRVHAHADGSQVRRLRAAGYLVTTLENTVQLGKRRQVEYRTALAARRRARLATVYNRGTLGYLSVDEVETALEAVAAPPNDTFTALIPLPQATWEGRTCHAVRVGRADADGPGIYFIGGVHGREWGSPDILIHFVRSLTHAYQEAAGVSMGGMHISPAAIHDLVEHKRVYVFPQVNPDGRHFSITRQAMWRKNRRPAPNGHPYPRCIGVDLNRNYDFLWDFPRFFNPTSPLGNSTNPCDFEEYIGPSVHSEPETRNVVWMLDTYRDIQFFVDLHSYGEAILYCWGDDVNQPARPDMNFRNPFFDRTRGLVDDTIYREYLAPLDEATVVHLAEGMRDAIMAVRGRTYRVAQAVSLYPVAGTSTDYAFSRHLSDVGKTKIASFAIEWGAETNATPFHPPYDEMARIIEEVTAALFDFCLRAT